MLRIINPHAAAGDVGSETIYVSVAGQPARAYGTVTRELLRLRDDLLAQGVDAFAMEFTGVYWLPLYEILEQTSIEVCLVNGAHVKSLPGRKTDVSDAMWIAELHAHGLLRTGFVPAPEIRRLRDYVRQRDNLITQAAAHLLRVQKSMELMNIKVHDVLSDLAGVSGQRVIRAMVSGERTIEKLVELCEPSVVKKKRQRLADALQGTWAAQHLFTLRQAWEAWQFCQGQIADCDREIEKVLLEMAAAAQASGPEPASPALRQKKRPSKNAPKILHLHETLVRVMGGKDPTQIPGLADYTVLQLVSEVGTDLSMFPTEKHFTSWLGLAPGTRNSGKRHRSYSRKGGRAGQAFRAVAQTVGSGTKSALGVFYRRIRAHSGGMVASKALGRKLAELYYRVMSRGLNYVEEGLEKAEKRYVEESHKRLTRLAHKLGYKLVPEVGNTQPIPS